MHQICLLNDRKQLDAAESAVTGFFKDLAKGRFTAARNKVAPDFQWFGRKVSKEDWSGKALAKFVDESKLKVGTVRVGPRDDIAAIPRYALVDAFGPLVQDDQVFLVDVTKGGTTSTTAVVVSCKDKQPVLKRAVDPKAFTLFVRIAESIDQFFDDAT